MATVVGTSPRRKASRALSLDIPRHSLGLLRRVPFWMRGLIFAAAAALAVLLGGGITNWPTPSNWSHQQQAGDWELRHWAGTTAERRRLVASRGSRKAWQGWGSAAIQRLGDSGPLLAHYFLHVSKSGGTSVCSAVKDEAGCKASDARAQGGLCHTPALDTKPKWTRDPDNYFGLPLFVQYSQNHGKDPGKDPDCREVETASKLLGIRFLANENYLSDDGACSDRFLTSIVMRDPVDRILSHYNHMYRLCTEVGRKKHRCNEMLYSDDKRTDDDKMAFNVSIMKDRFDFVSDNYYVRSLSGKEGFESPYGFLGNDKSMLEKSLKVLATYDWIMLIDGRGSSGQNNALIFKKGLGFESHLGRQNLHHSDSQYAGLTTEDRIWLLSLNSPDYALWGEAQRLHSLDVASIHMLEDFAPKVLRLNRKGKGNEKCCGNICTN